MKARSALTRGRTITPADRQSRDRLGTVSLVQLIAYTGLVLTMFCSLASSALAQGTAFTYQGRLANGGAPANGSYDFTFTLCNVQTGPGTIAGPVTNLASGVTNGLFTVTLDFGSVFDGNARWLEIGVRTNGGGTFTTLTPRQLLTPSPYALYAPNAGAAATVTSVPLSALPASVPRLDTNAQLSITGDLSVVAPMPLLAEGFEGATFPPAAWASGGNAAWVRTNNFFTQGAWAASSGTIGNNEMSYLELNCHMPASAVLKFEWKVDSEPGYDFLQIYVDGILRSGISGSNNWTPMTLPVGAGTHTIRWVYTKDVSLLSGQDRGWIDNVRLVIGTGSITTEALSVTGQLTVNGQTYFPTNVGIGTLNPMRPLQIGDAGVLGSQGMIRIATRSTNGGENRIWDVGVPQTGSDLTGAGYSFMIDDTQLGTEPEFIVHWGNGRVGIGRTNPVSALDVNGTVTATAYVGNASGMTNLSAAVLTGTIPDARLSASVALLNSNQTFTGSNGFAGVVTLTNPSNTLAGSHFGDGSGLTNINAASINGFSGMTVVSTVANDASLTSSGYCPMMTVPAPPWGNGSSSEASSARAEHTATWTGQRLLVWGGKIANNLFTGSGAMYHPDADQWETMTTLSAPAARAGHTAVWAGDKLVIWGGYDGSGWLRTGAKFQPDQPSWTAVATNAAPVERSGHIAVWTGSRMVVWGGRNATGLLNNGALYDPTANQWTTLSLASPPEARMGATAVWTGTRLLLWGGEGSSGILSNGAQLVFSGATPIQWIAMSSVNAPSARRGHTAIWTGQKMLVWGGEQNGAPLGDGGAFDPMANTWEPLTWSNAPAPRFQHSAVWTGEEMLILGGSTGGTELASGSAYNPLTGVWRPLSNSGAPQPRMDATAAWTDTEVLVFGGRAQGQYLSALQRLVPQPIWYFYRKL